MSDDRQAHSPPQRRRAQPECREAGDYQSHRCREPDCVMGSRQDATDGENGEPCLHRNREAVQGRARSGVDVCRVRRGTPT